MLLLVLRFLFVQFALNRRQAEVLLVDCPPPVYLNSPVLMNDQTVWGHPHTPDTKPMFE